MSTAIFFLLCSSCGVHAIHRLSGDIKPTFYSIEIHPDLDTDLFSGAVCIRMNAIRSVTFIELHSSGLNISRIHLDGIQVMPKDFLSEFTYELKEGDVLRIDANHDEIGFGGHILDVEFSGKLSKDGNGIIKTGFTRNNQTLSSIVATSFQPNYARRMFPCFDEPAFKAKFQLNVLVPNSTYSAVSNMGLAGVVTTSKGILHKFQTTTKPMSTYLLAFVISQHTSKFYSGNTNITFRIYSHNNIDETDNKLLVFADNVIAFLSNYTGYDYEFPKIDFVEFDRIGSEAAENWGLITMSTGLVSSDETLYDNAQKCSVIAHELSHFWFGNLVTNTWWEDLWLHEGFAVYMGLKAEEHVLKNNGTKTFKFEYRESLMVSDTYHEALPVIGVRANSLENIFNDYTYQKGAAVLQMIELVMGYDNFRSAVACYICRFATQSVSTDDFLQILEKFESNINLRQMAETYLYQNRYPVLIVEEHESHYELRQKPCIKTKNETDFSRFGYKWTIPVTYIRDSFEGVSIVWFEKDMDTLIINKNGENWIKFNYKHEGYYRVNYDKKLGDKLLKHRQNLTIEDRNSLMMDAISLFQLNEISCDVALLYLQKGIYYKDLKREDAFVAYLKVKSVIQHVEKAFNCLKGFFCNMFKRAGEVSWAGRILEDQPEVSARGHSNESDVNSDKIEKCVRYLVNSNFCACG